MTTTAAATTAGVETASAPHESLRPHGRPDEGAAAARTEAFFTEYHRTVSGLCRALMRDRAEAEDAAQQTFLSAHRALLNGSDPQEPAAWLATIARNECWSRIRTRMREPLPSERLEAESTDDPVAEAIRRADLAALWSAIEALPGPQRNALLLREFGGLSYAELAAALGVSGSAVESLLFRARRRLQLQLRAAYASLTGASWIEALVRVFAGGGAPVAAKVAALGVGAAAVGSSAVVVPHVLDNHTHVRQPAQIVVHAKRTKRPAPVLAAQVEPEPSQAPTLTPAAVVVRPHAQSEQHESGEHGRPSGETDDRSGRDDGPAAPSSGSGSDRSGHGGGGGGGDTGDDGTSSHDGTSGERAGSDDPAVTATVAETVETEASEDDHSGRDGGSDGSDDSGGHSGEGP